MKEQTYLGNAVTVCHCGVESLQPTPIFNSGQEKLLLLLVCNTQKGCTSYYVCHNTCAGDDRCILVPVVVGVTGESGVSVVVSVLHPVPSQVVPVVVVPFVAVAEANALPDASPLVLVPSSAW